MESVIRFFRANGLVFFICALLVPLARMISPATVIDGNVNYLAWLPLSVILAVIFLYGCRAVLPLIFAFSVSCLWIWSVTPQDAILFLAGIFGPVLAVCFGLRRCMGTRWRHKLGGRGDRLRIFWLGFFLPCAIKALLSFLGFFFELSNNTAPFSGSTSYLSNVLDIQGLIVSSLIFPIFIYYPLRMLISPVFRRAVWFSIFAPVFRNNDAVKSVGWMAGLVLLLWAFCSPANSELFSASMLPLLFVLFTLGIRIPGAGITAWCWSLTVLLLLEWNKNVVHSTYYSTILVFILSVFIAFTVCLFYMIRMYRLGVRLHHIWRIQALTDPMTWLPNLRSLELHVRQYPQGVLCCLRLNNLSFLDRHYGFMMGVCCKRQVGQLLTPHLRPGERVFQFSECELLLFLHPGEHVQRLNTMLRLLNQQKMPWKGNPLNIEYFASWGKMHRASGGLGQKLGQLSYMAEQATTREPLVSLDAQEEEVVGQPSAQVVLFQKIKQALDNRHLVIVAQPVVGQAGMVYAEVLSRLMVDGDLMMPDTFLPIITQCDLSAHFDMLVMEKMVCWLAEHPEETQGTRFSVNLMPSTLMQRGIASDIIRLFAHHNISPACVVIEVTEAQAFSTAECTMLNIRLLRQAGFRIAIDDFGTGYSNYERLKHLNADIVKIDGCFIRHILTCPEDVIIVQSICALAKFRGLSVVAEFVETEPQRELLYNLGVDYLQGYLVGKPALLA